MRKISANTLWKISSLIILLVICILMMCPPIMDRINLKRLNDSYLDKIESLKDDITNLEQEKSDLIEDKQILTDEVTKLTSDAKNIDEDIINNLDKYIKLRDKYSYVLSYSPKSDFGLTELIYLSKTCEEFNVPIPIMLAIYEKESGFVSTAKNKISTATGYGQLLKGTAKSMYEKYLNLGTYDTQNHRVLSCNKKLNIRMSTRLIKYNYDSYGSFWKAVERYYGSNNQSANSAYASDINRRMQTYGASLSK